MEGRSPDAPGMMLENHRPGDIEYSENNIRRDAGGRSPDASGMMSEGQRPGDIDDDVQNPTTYIRQPNFTNSRNQTLDRLDEFRTKDVTTRIQEVFIEIDLLGNYTHSTWFSGLNMYSYIKFIQELYNIWTHRSNMSLHVRSQICPYYSPFSYQIDTINIFASHNINLNNLRNVALTIIENIVFSGGDIEFRKIGVMHILTALTFVSIPARENLPWLYESVAFHDI